MADIQIPQLPSIQDAQREQNDLFMVRDVTDGFDRKITHRQLLNLFKSASQYTFDTDDTLSVGDFGLGRTAIPLNNLAPEYSNLNIINDMTSLTTGVFRGDLTTVNKPLKVAGSFFHILSIQDQTADNESQLTFGIQSEDGMANRGQATNKRMFVKSVGDTGAEFAVAYAEETYTRQEIDEAINSALQDKLYPVGSIYTSLNPNLSNPAVILEFGTWTPIQGRVLVGQGGGDPQFATTGASGGQSAINYSEATGNVVNNMSVDGHAVTEAEMPSHQHSSGTIVASNGGSHSHGINDSGHTHSYQSEIGTSGTDEVRLVNDTERGSIRTNEILSATTGITVNSSGSSHSHTTTGDTGSTGGGQEHDHGLSGEVSLERISTVQPYLVVKMWQRIA